MASIGQAQGIGYQGDASAAREMTLGETVHEIEKLLDGAHETVQVIEDHIHGTGPRPVSDRDAPQPMPPAGLRNASLRIRAGLDGLRDRLLKIAQAL